MFMALFTMAEASAEESADDQGEAPGADAGSLDDTLEKYLKR